MADNKTPGRRATLQEVLGAGEAKVLDRVSLRDLPSLLGEKTPELPKDRVGRMRLVRALSQRFGPGFRNVPGVKNMMSEFDEEVRFQEVLNKMKLKAGGKRG